MTVKHQLDVEFEGYTWRDFAVKIVELAKVEGIPDDARLIFFHTGRGFADEAGVAPTGKRTARFVWETDVS